MKRAAVTVGAAISLIVVGWLIVSIRVPRQLPSLPGSRSVRICAYDTLPESMAQTVRFSDHARIEGVSSSELVAIRSAVGRTPGVKYEILAVESANNYDIGVVLVTVPRHKLILMKDLEGRWHVIRIVCVQS